ncbi:hypothetical protein PR048_021974 [Dryococelus australis]|uniref:Uncharacterized protein n=1 Tax=Dryococelus australis TaxID=614101 RepID=A0ABQ9GZQ5_9NEOP|nr:hypothetical protein PR048_021974 [Dryococelus australis]
MKDSLVKERIISGLLDEVKTKLLNTNELTQLKTMTHDDKMASINAVNNGWYGGKKTTGKSQERKKEGQQQRPQQQQGMQSLR